LQSVWVYLWAWQAVPLLQVRRERSAGRPAASDELAALHSITSFGGVGLHHQPVWTRKVPSPASA
jgi:hypothetical protein